MNCKIHSPPLPPRRYPKFGVVAGIAFSDYPERYVEGSISTGRVSHANQVKGDDPDKKKGILWSYWLAVGRGADNPISQNICSLQNLLKLERRK